VTAGTSLAPSSVIFWPPTIGDIVAQLASNPTAPATTSADVPANLLAILIIVLSIV
jgi:hypothetical protein